jgi:hypothetical protein
VMTGSGHPAPFPDFTAKDRAKYYGYGKGGRDRLAALCSNCGNVVVPNTGHFTSIDPPAAAVRRCSNGWACTNELGGFDRRAVFSFCFDASYLCLSGYSIPCYLGAWSAYSFTVPVPFVTGIPVQVKVQS